MTYALERRTVADKPRLAAFFAGRRLELVELPFGSLSDLSIAARANGQNPAQAVLGAALYVDGAPIGLEGLRELPGRLGVELSELMVTAMRLHGMGLPEGTEDDEATPGAPEPAEEPAGEAPRPA